MLCLNHHRKDGKRPLPPFWSQSQLVPCLQTISHLSGGDLYKAFRPFFRWSQTRIKSKLQTEKTMVGFGRTELSLSLSCTEFRALSHGHGFRGPCFQGVRKSWVFHEFWIVFLTMCFDICLTGFMKRFNGHVRIEGWRAENDSK